MHACTREHYVQFCGLCAEFPCEKLPSLITWNTDAAEKMTVLRNEYRSAQIYLTLMTPGMYHCYFREFENDPDLWLDKEKYVPYIYSKEKAEQYIQRQTELKRINLAIMYGNDIAGEIVLKNIEEHRCATMGIMLKNDTYKGRGIGTQAEKLTVRYVFNVLNIPVLFADSIRTNTRSQHVLEKAGFRFIREDRDFRYYRIDREPHVPA